MAKKAQTETAGTAAPSVRQWTPEELMADRHLGHGMIGQEKYDAIQAYIAQTNGGHFGPALLNSKAHSQAGPVKIENGVPVFADAAAE